MGQEIKNFRELLRAEFHKRIVQIPNYRLLDFAKDMGTPVSRMCEILSGRSKISVKRALRYSEILHLDPETREKMLELLIVESAKGDQNKQAKGGQKKPGKACLELTLPVAEAKKEEFYQFFKQSLEKWLAENNSGETAHSVLMIEVSESQET